MPLPRLHCVAIAVLWLSHFNGTPTDGLASVARRSGGGGGGFGATVSKQNHSPDVSDATLALVQWLESNGATVSKGIEIGFHKDHGMRGVYATKNFPKQSILCKIPSDYALALSDPNDPSERPHTVVDDGRNFLSLYRNHPVQAPVWAPYLDTLPSVGDVDATPDLFEEDEIHALEFPRAIRLARERQRLLVAESAADSCSCPYTLEELRYATWLMSSRAFQLNVDSNDGAGANAAVDVDVDVDAVARKKQKSIRVLLPFIDMINHRHDSNAELHLIDPEKDEAWFSIRSTRPIRAGSEITISYGGGIWSSVELLTNYGFVPSSNPIDKLMLKKGGDEIISSLDGWTTSLEEDEHQLLTDSTLSENMKKVLQLRCQLKRSYA